MHALATLLGTPNQLLVNTNIYSTNRESADLLGFSHMIISKFYREWSKKEKVIGTVLQKVLVYMGE